LKNKVIKLQLLVLVLDIMLSANLHSQETL